jgi:hypothetical protein
MIQVKRPPIFGVMIEARDGWSRRVTSGAVLA